MKKIASLLLVASIPFVGAGTASADFQPLWPFITVQPATNMADPEHDAQNILDNINQDRAVNGLPAMTLDDALSQHALERAQELVAQGDNYNYGYLDEGFGENSVATNAPSQAVQAWETQRYPAQMDVLLSQYPNNIVGVGVAPLPNGIDNIVVVQFS